VAANIATALTVAILLRLTLGMGFWDSRPALIVWDMAILLCYTSIALTIFNLIPIPPLDGSHVLSQLLPYEAARNYDRLQPYGYFILFLLVITRVVGLVLWWPVTHIAQVLLGPANIYWDVF
jgi:Zn-dependent protease